MTKIFLKAFLLLLLVTKTAFSQDFSQRKPLIVVSINPIYQIISAITQSQTNNILVVNPSLSEHDYFLKKQDARAVSEADLIFYVSEDLEKNFSKLVASQNKKPQSFELIKIKDLKLLQNKKNPKKIDPHIWLDPENAIKIAEFVMQKIAEIDQKNSSTYQRNLQKFKKEIFLTKKTIKSQLFQSKASNYLFFHDGYQYFENYFGLKPLKTIFSNHDQELSIKDLRKIDALAKQGKIKCVLGEKWDKKNTAQKLAQNYKIKFVSLDLIGQNSGYADLLLKISADISSCMENKITDQK